MDYRVFGLVGAILATACAAFAGPLRPGELIVTDQDAGRLVVIDPDSGDQRVLSADGVAGNGPPLVRPNHVLLTKDQRIFVRGGGDNPILEVDPRTGDRTVILGESTGFERGDFSLGGLVLTDEGLLVTVDGLNSHLSRQRLVRINPDTGESRFFGPRFERNEIPLDLINGLDQELYLLNTRPSQIRVIHLEDQYRASLTRLLAAPGFAGPGLSLTSPHAIALGPSGDVFATGQPSALYAVLRFDPETQLRTLVTGSNQLDESVYQNPYVRGDGPALTAQLDLEVADDGTIYSVTHRGIFRIDPDTGNRELVLAQEVRPGVFGLTSLAVVPIPEPGSGLLASATLAVGLSIGRR